MPHGCPRSCSERLHSHAGRDSERLRFSYEIWPVEAESVEQLFGALAWIPPGVEYTVEGDTELLAFLGKTSARAAEALRTR